SYRPRQALEEGQRGVQQGLPRAGRDGGALAGRAQGLRGRRRHVARGGGAGRERRPAVRLSCHLDHHERHLHQREPRPRGARGRQSVRVRVVLQPTAAQRRDRLARKLGGDRLTDGLRRDRLREGVVLSLALVPSVFVYATVFGGLAVQAGLHVVEVLAMSVLVFAGASQFVAVPMIAGGASPLSVIFTTYVVNMRHYLMAATLAPSLGAFSRRRLALIAHVVNDESFAVAVSRSRPPDAAIFLGSAAAIFVAFVGGVTVGTLIGGLVAEPGVTGSISPSPPSFWPSWRLSSAIDWTGSSRSAALSWRSPSPSGSPETGTSSSLACW